MVPFYATCVKWWFEVMLHVAYNYYSWLSTCYLSLVEREKFLMVLKNASSVYHYLYVIRYWRLNGLVEHVLSTLPTPED